jgi:hypothetical protein
VDKNTQDKLREHLMRELFNGHEGQLISRSVTLLLNDTVQAVAQFIEKEQQQ